MFTLSTLKSFHVSYRHSNEKIRLPDLVKEVKEALSITEEELLPILDKWTEAEYTKINNILVDIEYEVNTMKKEPQAVYEDYKARIEAINKELQKG
jgi:hypothetical protein